MVMKNKFGTRINSYLNLMKPSIMLLVLLTGATALVLDGSLLAGKIQHGPLKFALILLGLMLTGGSANAFNMYLEREIDAKMTRTRNRRPLPLGLIKPINALYFAFIIGIVGVFIFGMFFNLLSAFLAFATIAYYSIFYTVYLKPRTPYNIIIGGAAGSMAPIIAWASVTNNIGIVPILLFVIIFLWTPPHFWALALYLREDYELAQYPMMPIVKGDSATKRQMLVYVIALVISSLALIRTGAGIFYIIISTIVGGLFCIKSIKMLKPKSNEMARGFFRYSIVYLFAIFTVWPQL